MNSCRRRALIITILVLSLIFVSWKLYERLSIDHYSPIDFISSFSTIPEMTTAVSVKNKTTFVTAYYTIPNKYDSGNKPSIYLDWISNFIKFSKRVSLVIFTTGKDLIELKKIAKESPNIYFVDLPIERFFVHSYQSKFKKQKEIDPEKDIHSVELYMIWNEKPYFVKRAMSITNSSHYCWIDIGIIRDSQLSSVMLDFPDQSGLDFLYQLNKVVLIGIEPDNLKKFKNTDGISTIKNPPVTIAGGFLFGSKEQLEIYVERYYRLFDEYFNRNVFAGKDQNLISNLIVNYNDDFVILDSSKIKTWLTEFQTNSWFSMINLLSGLKLNRPFHTPKIMGGLGNQLFIVSSIYGISRKRGEIFVLSSNDIQVNPHNSESYLDTVFRRFLRRNLIKSDEKTAYQESYSHAYDENLINVPKSTYQSYSGYFQNYKYFIEYIDELRLLFDLPQVPETNRFFIHIRLGDYVNNKDHYIDLKYYYQKCLTQIQEQYGQVEFCVFTNDEKLADDYLKNNLPSIQYTFGDKKETIALTQMSQCSLGGICANSTFSWWGAMLNRRKNKKIFFPNRLYPNTSVYRDYDISGLFYPDFTIITI